MSGRRALALVAVLFAVAFPASTAGCSPAAPLGPPPEPSVGVWYRGQPAGVPRLDDLAVMKALDFSSVTWPASSSSGIADLRRFAATIGLTVVTRDRPASLTTASALAPGEYVDVAVTEIPPAAIAALVWRAVAHGARVVSFDPGPSAGTGLINVGGEAPAWMAPAKSIARTLSFNAQLMKDLRPGPPVTIDPPKPPDLDVVLLDANRSWVVVATSTADTPVRATVRLPREVPYALWVNLLDGTNMSMLSQPAGPVWSLDFTPHGAVFYIIDKALK